MTQNRTIFRALTAISALALAAACASSSNDGRAGVPDEFKVVKKAPLTVPPEYSLRPPERGTVRPLEVTPERVDQVFAFGTDIGTDASEVERRMIALAGAVAVSPVIREIIDYDEAGLLRKPSSVSDAVTGYSGSEEERAAAAEDNATGGEVTIERGSGRRLKLPGT